jgi:tetratricopeptide (TPR) repeat protein
MTLLALAIAAAAAAWPSAQGGAPQKPADAKPAAATDTAQKPAEAQPAEELPAEAKAFNTAAGEKDPLKRVTALEKFVADHPKASPMIVSQAKAQISSSSLAAYKESRAKYLAAAEADIAEAKKRTEGMPIYFTYNSLASRLAGAGIFSEEAEDYARKGLAAMDERTYMDQRKQQYERALAAYEKNAASAAKPAAAATPDAKPEVKPEPKPEPKADATPVGAADAAAGKTPPPPNYRFAMKDGVMQVSIAPPAKPRPAAAPRPPAKPTMPTEAEMRASLRSERASAQATLGQILMKRGKAEEGEKLLAEAFTAKPPAATMATIARTLAESAKKAGNDSAQLEYLTVLALSGRITADETKDFEAAYRKTHNGSLDGLEAMLDERYRRDHTRFAVTPYVRKPGTKATGKAVLAEVFPGAG